MRIGVAWLLVLVVAMGAGAVAVLDAFAPPAASTVAAPPRVGGGLDLSYGGIDPSWKLSLAVEPRLLRAPRFVLNGGLTVSTTPTEVSMFFGSLFLAMLESAARDDDPGVTPPPWSPYDDDDDDTLALYWPRGGPSALYLAGTVIVSEHVAVRGVMGDSWEKLWGGPPLRPRPFFGGSLLIAPDHARTAWTVGYDTWRGATVGLAFRMQ